MPPSGSPLSDLAAAYLRLHLADGIGPVYLGRLIKRFGTIDGVLSASIADLCTVEGIGERRARAIFDARNNADVEREIERADRIGARIICWEDPDYPRQLRHCDDPPICLYVRGTLQPEDAVAIAIVGSRKCSRYGYEQAQRFAGLLAGAGFTIVSGLARGIDGYAHEGALASRGRTLAVLGSGVDVIYPPEHAALADRVMASGAIMAEDPLGSPPAADSFPRRNRIIAGMCLGVLVVEAGKRSGALITARLASEYNREVFAVPGRVDNPTAAGPNDLIRTGAAKLVACLEDVLDELGQVGSLMVQPQSDEPGRSSTSAPDGSPAGQPGRSPDDKPSRSPKDQPDRSPEARSDSAERALLAALDPNERSVWDCLGREERHIEEVIAETGMNVGPVTAALTMLQLKGAVVALPGNRFVRRAD